MSHQATIADLEDKYQRAKRARKKRSHIEQRIQDIRTAQLRDECEEKCHKRVGKVVDQLAKENKVWCCIALVCGVVGTLLGEQLVSYLLR